MQRSLPGTSGKAKPASPGKAARGAILGGLAAIFVGFGGFGAWAALAPLQSAAIASGQIAVDSYRKTIQHLEGGIIGELLVRDGSVVQAGDVLVRLDDTRPRTNLALLTNQYHNALARRARLLAERDGHSEIAFPEPLREHVDDPQVAEIMQGQRNVFAARRQFMRGRLDILEQRIARFRKEIAALDSQQQAEQRQLSLISDELAGVRKLFEQGLERKPRLLALEREAAQIEGMRGEHLALIARAEQNIAGTEMEMIGLRNELLDEVTRELRETQAELDDLEEKMLSAADTLRRTVIRAPQPGIVVGMRFHTKGGVVAPGEPILDLVPQNDRLLVEAHVRPQDIDVVEAGLPAQVQLTAFSRRYTPTIEGEVVLVSADRLDEKESGESYYLARVELDPASLEALPDGKLYPGMPVEVMIVTGERTALDYLMAPLTRSVARAFREQ